VSRLYVEPDARLRFRTDASTQRAVTLALRERRRTVEDQLHARNMVMLGESVSSTPSREVLHREVLHVVADEKEEALWRAWRAYSVA
jgi:hypothetical protein